MGATRVAVVALGVLFVSCGGGEDATGNELDGSTQPSAPEATPGPDPSTVAESTDDLPSRDTTSGDTAPGDTGPGDTGPGDTGPGETAGVEPEGFSTIGAVITSADGEECEVCLWLADTADERGRGLMGVTDLGDADGMAFRFDDPTTGSFYMFQTPTPLSIAWFADDGRWVGGEEMEPCLDTPAGDCPLYSPGAAYTVAVEAFTGGLEPLGIGPGSRIEFAAGSEAPTCPT